MPGTKQYRPCRTIRQGVPGTSSNANLKLPVLTFLLFDDRLELPSNLAASTKQLTGYLGTRSKYLPNQHRNLLAAIWPLADRFHLIGRQRLAIHYTTFDFKTLHGPGISNGSDLFC